MQGRRATSSALSILSVMTSSTRTRTVLSRAGLALAATGALMFSAACNDAAPSDDGDQQQEQQDGGDDGGDQEDGDDG